MVGAGPGDPDLLTVRANRLIRQCDALVYDALVPNEILKLVKEDCKCIFVGKRRGHHSTPQLRINALLVDLAKQHNCVVRLKGGDPFVFGRGGEEAIYLQQHGISVKVVPGITSGVAAAAYLGIPLTHRLAGSSVTFVTGHEGINKKHPLVDWQALAKGSNTLIIYMGIHNISFIVNELLEGGLSPQVPVAVIQQATVTGQKYLKTSLDMLVYEVERKQMSSPAIVIIGQIINYQVEASGLQPANVTMPIID